MGLFFTSKKKKTTLPQKQESVFSLEDLNQKVGEIPIDLYQTEDELVIRAPIAGTKMEDLDISIEGDVIIINGKREEPEEEGKIDYFTKECYFGPFSRKIISPVEIDASQAKAKIKEGILIVRIPKIKKEKKVKVKIEKE